MEANTTSFQNSGQMRNAAALHPASDRLTEVAKLSPSSSQLWTQEEDNTLNKLYNTDSLDIIEISKLMNRAPGAIISRLYKHKYIQNRTSARGYMIYKNSDLYKSIVATSEETRKRPKDEDRYRKLQEDILDMKTEMKEMKMVIKELVEMMKAVYEFEDLSH
jgi:hypothetical protein